MYRNMKKISKELGYKGWCFLMEDEDKMYLSKFDPEERKNEDEYRIYFFIKEDGIQIVRRFVILASKYKENIEPDNKFYKEAETILNTYFSLYREIHNKAS